MPILPLGAVALCALSAHLIVNKLTMPEYQKRRKTEELERALRTLPPATVRLILDAIAG
jgi:hypothetical protein